ncbi:HbrB-like-domain-containing protein, partial [Epithele typhae]|uniref:HbrB-like-domain-containing protein n=1 Tax=Epithele typhae TaxID=378194 RepID=UPI002008A1D6
SSSAAAAPSVAQRSATQPIPQALLPTRTHSRGDSGLPLSVPGSMASSSPQMSKPNPSPSKPSSARTYDSKLVSREMHRLGTLAHLPSTTVSLSAASASSLALAMPASTAPSLAQTLSNDNPWTSLHVLVLPLFNGEPLRVPIEDLNQLARRHISTVVSAAPSKAFAGLENDTFELIANGMVTLNSKLSGVDEEKLVLRIGDLWTFFWTQVLPYLEGALLPLQTDPVLFSLYRGPKSHRPSSPTTTQNGKGSKTLLQATGPQIDVRALALVSFRDRIILPLFPRLYARLTMFKDEHINEHEVQTGRLRQMLLVLVSQRSQRFTLLSLTANPPQLSQGEAAVARLLRAMHAPIGSLAPRTARATAAGAPSFLSAGAPRDRRGRIAQKTDAAMGARPRSQWRMGGGLGMGARAVRRAGGRESADWDDGEMDTPRGTVAFADLGRERDKELLESLRSPDLEATQRMSMGGWGLGAGREDDSHADDEEND